MARITLFFLLAVFAAAAPLQNLSPPLEANGETDWDMMFKEPPIPPFTCQKLEPSPAKTTDVNRLRFPDIDVVMALGDSITAAFAAHATFKLGGFLEYKGISWSIGGDKKDSGRDAYSLPNFLRLVTGKLPKGASKGDDIPIDAIQKDGKMPYHGLPWVDHLNAAQSSAQVQDMVAQVEYLAQQLKKDKSVNMDEDWKMLTIMIGANNACGACHHGSHDTPDFFYEQMNATISKVYETIPRTFVNLVQMFNTSGVYTQQQTSKYCVWVQKKVTECSCMEGSDSDRKQMDEALVAYNNQYTRIEAEWAAKNLTTFKVVVQPALRDMPVPNRDYLSGLDCFHPNNYAHGAFAIGLWNNLQSPPGQKSTLLIPGAVNISCPAADSFLQ